MALGIYAQSDFCSPVMEVYLFLSWYIMRVKYILCVLQISKRESFF